MAVLSAILPLWIAKKKGYLPKALFVRWGISLSLGTLLLVFGIRWIEFATEPLQRIILSVVLGLFFLGIGTQLAVAQRKSFSPSPGTKRLQNLLTLMFLCFGFAWILLSLFKN